jgi:signal transduction histidine kinase
LRLAAQLSHDLRTPLANLRLYAELMARRAQTDDAVQRYVAVMDTEIGRLESLAEAAVAVARGGPASNLATAAPDALVRRTLDRLEERLAASACRSLAPPGVSIPLQFDVVGFERALVNLVENARKYAPGRIEVTTGYAERRLTLAVRDHGPGFVAGEGVAPVDGYGLGLEAVREIAEANGGRLRISSADPGSRVEATFRARPAKER